jgi:hypothetical protein
MKPNPQTLFKQESRIADEFVLLESIVVFPGSYGKPCKVNIP